MNFKNKIQYVELDGILHGILQEYCEFRIKRKTNHFLCNNYSPLEKKPQQIKKRYDVNVRETRLEVPMLKKYLPAYQAPGLIEELKEHDRMRLIQEREARRWIALSALRSTRDSPSSSKSRDRGTCGTSVICDETVSGLTSVKKIFYILASPLSENCSVFTLY